jgi:hypothetical protein
MNKRKIFLLIPITGLFLTGCTLQEGWNWVNSNIFSPIGTFFSNLFGLHNEAKPKDKSEDQKVYEDSFNAKKLLLERNLKWEATSKYVRNGEESVSKYDIGFDSGKAKLSVSYDEETFDIYAKHIYNESSDNFSVDWYTRAYHEEEFMGYYKTQMNDLTANNVAFQCYSLIIDVPFEDLVQKDGYYEVQNISRDYSGDIITISSYKVYIGKTFVSKVHFEGKVVIQGEESPMSTDYVFSDFGQVHVELPTETVN